MHTPRVLIWNEYRVERAEPEAAAHYPNGMHETIGQYLRGEGFPVKIATFDEPDHGLTEEALAETDVLIWWGNKTHNLVSDEAVERVCRRVLEGMGLIALHSAHHSKVFKRLMGTSGNIKWRIAAEKERLWVVAPGHPITEGLPEYIELPAEEMFGEHFDIPEPDKLVFVSWFQGGEVFRSGCCFERGRGKIFYFRPGHQTYPTFHNPHVLRTIGNAVRWAAPVDGFAIKHQKHEPLEPLGVM